ncbi:MAG: YeeE/YedE family protein [Candidatus Lokiarchaeota archaeon]|nr:YeeE/YedE family protein [Candidatus Lokiarchaeota archaeon]
MATGLLAADVALAIIPYATLGLGFLVGYLAQRSGFCSIGGFRDLLLFKQTRLFFGYMALIASAFVSYWIFSMILPAAFNNFYWAASQTTNVFTPIPGSIPGVKVSAWIFLAIIGGFGMGFIGVLLGGCPLRQCVMGSEGNLKSLFFFLGLCVGAVIYHAFLLNIVKTWLNAIFLV